MCVLLVFFFNDTATTEIYTYSHTLSLHDALPIWSARHSARPPPRPRRCRRWSPRQRCLCFCLCRGRRGRGCRGPAAAPGRRTVCVAWGSLSLLVARDLFSSCVLYAPASRFVPGCCAPRAGLTGAGPRLA